MPKIIDYITISEIGPDGLTKAAQKALTDGYQPFGAPLVWHLNPSSPYIVQVMVKYDPTIVYSEADIN